MMLVVLLVIILDPFGNESFGVLAGIISTEIYHFSNCNDERRMSQLQSSEF